MNRAQLLSGLAMLLYTAGCADVTSEEPVTRLGRFRLARINGNEPPAFVTEGAAARIDFLGGAVHLEKDGSFADSTDLRITPKIGGSIRTETDVAIGRYRISNDSVFFDSTRGEHYLMVYISHQALKQELGGSTLLYNR